MDDIKISSVEILYAGLSVAVMDYDHDFRECNRGEGSISYPT